MPSAAAMHDALRSAAAYASARAEALNEPVHDGRREARVAQSEWVAEYVRCDEQADALEVVVLDDEDRVDTVGAMER